MNGLHGHGVQDGRLPQGTMAAMTDQPSTHAERIRDQFTRQAEPFAAMRLHSQEQSLDWIREELRLTGAERVVDAGCGPGLVALHLAPHAREVVGVDATPAMVAKARSLAADRGCPNATFTEGVIERLPCADRSVDAVVTRYTFHHLVDPRAAIAEMVRICRPGGRVVVCDATPQAACRDAYDAWERIRDPSHTSARTPEELEQLARERLTDVAVRRFRLPSDLETLIAHSFPVEGGATRLHDQLRADIGNDRLDFAARIDAGRLSLAFPISIVSGTRP